MKFVPAAIAGAYEVALEPHLDERGHFVRTWDAAAFRTQGLETAFVQHSVSFNARAGTLRGMHFQRAPHAETKLIRCIRGRAFDVIVDLRRDSETFLQWQGFEIGPESFNAIYVPPGIAHGFQTLADDTELAYMITPAYSAPHASGVRWDDPAFAIGWPGCGERTMSEKDRAWEDFAPESRGE